MKQRLTELLYEKQHQLIDSGEPFELESYADYLIENGTIAPPCNVSGTAYLLSNTGRIRYLTVTQIDVKLRKNETTIRCLAEFDLDGNPCTIEIIPSKIGEIFFFNLEDAQKALKKREG